MDRRPATINEPHGATPSAGPLMKPVAPKRSFASRLFGYDIFLSFALGPPPRGTVSYASDLARRLRERDFTVFFSEDEAPPGDHLDSTLRAALASSKILIVIANRATLNDPRWVREEVEEFRDRRPGGVVIPVSVGGALRDPAVARNAQEWLQFQEKIWLDESEDAVERGIASDALVDRLATAPTRVRANVRWRSIVQAVVVVLAFLTTVAAWQWRVAGQERDRAQANERLAEQQKREAERQRAVAEDRLDQSRRGLYALQLSRVARIDRTDSDAAMRLLEDLKRSPLDLREFTWAYYKRLFSSPDAMPRVLGESNVAVQALAISPDSRTIATSAPNGIQLLDLDSGEKRIVGGLGGSVVSLAFSPNGESLAAVTDSLLTRETWLVNLASAEVKKLLEGRVYSVRFSHDGDTLALAGHGELRLWDLRTSTARTLFKGLRGRISVAMFSANDRMIATGGWDNSVRLWDVATGAERHTLKGHTATVIGLVFSEDGNTISSVSEKDRLLAGPNAYLAEQKPEVIVWDLHTGEHKIVVQSETGVPIITALSISPGGRTLATGHLDGSVALWDPRTWERRATLRAQDVPVLALEFSPDGLRLASGTGVVGSFSNPDTPGVVNVWEVEHWKNSSILRGPKGIIYDLAFTGANLLSSSGYDGGEVVTPGEVTLWNTVTGDARQLYEKFDDAAYASAIAPDGKWIAVATKAGVRLIDVETGKDRLLQKGVGPKNATHVAVAPDGKTLAWAGRRGPVELLDANDGRQIAALAARGPAAFSPDGRILATISEDGESVLLWDFPSRNPRHTLRGHSGPIYALAFSPNGASLATGGDDKSVKLWDPVSARELATLAGHSEAVRSVAFSPDGKLLAAGAGSRHTERGEFRLWDIRARAVLKAVSEPAGAVLAVAFSPDGQLLATAGRRDEGRARAGEVRLWLVSALR